MITGFHDVLQRTIMTSDGELQFMVVLMPRVSSDVATRSRELLDTHFDEWEPLRRLARPPRGWVRAIRVALGMSASALAVRLGTTGGAVIRLEQSEAADRVRLDTLRRAADALGCDLVYLLVPRRKLTAVVRERARQLARREVAAVQQTMRLEDQDTWQALDLEEQLTQQLIRRGGLWDGD
jgi:predicted DNA-binding mobile mystery protein A